MTKMPRSKPSKPENGSISARIRADIERNIVSGKWPPGYKIPFERELVSQYGCSRMTVNKALLALTANGMIYRRRSVGSFVSAPRVERSVLEIQDLAKEAARRGVAYRHEVRSRKVETLDPATAKSVGLGNRRRVMHVVCVHFMSDVPVAFEDRLISLAKVPEARKCTFEDTAPGTWLLQTVPWTEAEHIIRARSATPAIAKQLRIEPNAACLTLERHTWHENLLVTRVEIVYPGDRHQFVGRFSPVEHRGSE
ncbi:histidine utilization repressor [Bauldia sp.]|uniref:histidine utilization repressor n=1 Tax=Bauldia sp. TaxID=2575872 RepID=UPI0025BB0686|nr:histidine utilization repressor [Bauldia sp.]